ncbi:unnamed protein product [Prorocentrum cordatum]|uniref:RNA-directed RNA polymerase n=1 Tax=Prorocentrum cordatum TaxID=2364126 RepID=A0ABN9QAI9_9DINO|nr:unnamed protein product [Polarella glacialis]
MHAPLWPEPEENPRVRSLQTGRSPVRPGPDSGQQRQKENTVSSHSHLIHVHLSQPLLPSFGIPRIPSPRLVVCARGMSPYASRDHPITKSILLDRKVEELYPSMLLRFCANIFVACEVPTAAQLFGEPPADNTRLLDMLVHCSLVQTGLALTRRRAGCRLWTALSLCLSACSEWLFPEAVRWRRQNKFVEPLWAASAALRSLLWIAGNARNRWAQKACGLLEEKHRWALWRECRPKDWPAASLQAAVDDLLCLQLQAARLTHGAADLYGAGPHQLAGLYCWLSPSCYYVGVARSERVRQKCSPGVACRWLEHVTGHVRPRFPGSDKLRYRKMRQFSLDRTFFFLCRLGPLPRIRAMETCEIASRRPNANVMGRPPSRGGPVSPARPRKGLPKHLRQGGATQGPFDAPRAAGALAALSARFARPHADGPGAEPHSHCFPVFHRSYVMSARRLLAAQGVQWPVDIFAPPHARLLALWCGTRGACVDWHLLERRWRTPNGAIALSGHLGLLRGSGRKAVAARRVNEALRRRQLPPVHGLAVRVPRPSFLGAVRAILKSAIAGRADWGEAEKRWARTHIRLVAGALPKQRDKWNAVSVSKRMCVSLADTGGARNPDAAAEGRDMFRVDKVWDVPDRPSMEAVMAAVRSCVARACSQLGMPWHDAQCRIPNVVHVLRNHGAYAGERAAWPRTSHEYQAYVSDMCRSTDEVLVPDDKQNKFMWRMPASVYQGLLWRYAVLSPTWSVAAKSAAEANEWCLAVMGQLLSEPMKQFLGFDRYRTVLPYYYATIKSKCFVSGAKVCEKVAHSCVRKIVSCAAWPRRRRWRFLHRGLEHVMRASGGGDEVWSLKDAASTMEVRMAAARVRDGQSICARCHVRKYRVVGLVADAGQFYETVTPQSALSAAHQVLLRCAQTTGKTTVSVARRGRAAFLCGHARVPNDSFYCFEFRDLYLALAACMMLQFCSLGDVVFVMAGLPIGGVLSNIAASYVLGSEERRWTLDVRRRSDLGFTSTSDAWDREVARARYVDDIFWLSGVYCHDCLQEAVCAMYSTSFSVEPLAIVPEWLDLRFDTLTFCWSMADKPMVFAPPWGCGRNFVHGMLSGRLSRWSEVPLHDEAWLTALVSMLLELRRAGWSKGAVRAAIHRVSAKIPRGRFVLLGRAARAVWP